MSQSPVGAAQRAMSGRGRTSPCGADDAEDGAVQDLGELHAQEGEHPVRENEAPVRHRERQVVRAPDVPDGDDGEEDPGDAHREEDVRAEEAAREDHLARELDGGERLAHVQRQELGEVLAVHEQLAAIEVCDAEQDVRQRRLAWK